MARKKRKVIAKKIAATKKVPVQQDNQTFRWGESYTSLLLGIVVVVIGVLFFVSIVKSQHTKQVTSIATNILTQTTVPLHPSVSITHPSIMEKHTTPSVSMVMRQVTPTLTASPTPTNMPTATPVPTSALQQHPRGSTERVYIVQPGDDLWHISEKFYKSGYNYIDIAQVNHLDNPGVLFSGTKLIIPTVTPQPITVSPTLTQTPSPTQSINQNSPPGTMPQGSKATTYVVQKGDNLWDIAVKMYDDGYKWTVIAQANHLDNPGLIFTGNVLSIPR